MNRPASLAGSLPSPAQVGRTLRGLVPNRRGAAKLLVIAAVVFGLLGLLLVYSPIAHPRNLQVNGVTGPGHRAIQAAIEDTAHGQSTFAVSESALMRSVADYPQVAAVEIHAHPPFRLDLTVVMRPPVARVEIGGRAFVIAADGTVLDHAGSADVPKLEDSIAGLQIRETTLQGGRGVLRILGAAPEPLLSLARSIRAGKAGLEVVMSRGPRLIFGNSDYAADKWAAAAAVLADGPAVGASYIDLRVPARPAVGGLGGSHAAGYSDPPSLAVDPATAAAAATSAATTQASPSSGAAVSAPAPVTQAPATGSPAPSAGTNTGASVSGASSAGNGAAVANQTVPTGSTAGTQSGTSSTAGTASPSSSGSSSSGGASLGGTATP